MAGNQQYFSSYYNQYHNRPPLSEDDDRPEELEYYDDEEDSQADSYSDYSMGTASGSSVASITASSYSYSDMSISIASDDIHPHDSVSQRGFDQKSVVSDAPSVLSYHAGRKDILSPIVQLNHCSPFTSLLFSHRRSWIFLGIMAYQSRCHKLIIYFNLHLSIFVIVGPS
ncbi:hypothetical protein FRC02_009796 [Tulasnella sp. 418]|nr:hypothetical protein FRC02_009796 [Tulasnella sp. 418]